MRFLVGLGLGFISLSAAVVPAGAPALAAVPGAAVSYEEIPGSGGVPLKAIVVRPTGRGSGPHPLLVLPTSWALSNREYAGAAVRLAKESGYAVISYTCRGFHDSGGQIDVAGPKDIADARRVIDWAEGHVNADPDRVGMAGISYGSGISLMTSAVDARVRAVAAMSTWSDLEAAMYPNRTVNEQAALGLLTTGRLTGRPGPEFRQIERVYPRGLETIKPLADSRSAGPKIDQINARRPAIMIANGWLDGLFPPGQLTDFFTRLSGPKRLMLASADHGTREAAGAAGLPNEIWSAVRDWFDHHLLGKRPGVTGQAPVMLKTANTAGGWRGYRDWAAVTGRTQTRYLTGAGRLADAPATDWATRITTGIPTLADSGIVEVAGLMQQFLVPQRTWLPAVDRAGAGVWTGRPYTALTTISGAPRLRMTVRPTHHTTSLFAYLYDVDGNGTSALITHKPITLRDTPSGAAVSVDLRLEPISWQVPAGHRLALVVDTVDPRYRAAGKIGASVSFESPAALTIPLR